MNIDTEKFLTEEQKEQLGTALFEKLLDQINNMKFTNKTINLEDLFQDEVSRLFQDGYVLDNVDYQKIGEALTKKIINGL